MKESTKVAAVSSFASDTSPAHVCSLLFVCGHWQLTCYDPRRR